MTDKQIIAREILYQGLNWHIGVDGSYINGTEKEPIFNHLYEVALACRDKSEQLKRKEQECEQLKKELDITSCANIELSLEVKKYEKAIEEIEEIADNNNENPEMKRIFYIIGGLNV